MTDPTIICFHKILLNDWPELVEVLSKISHNPSRLLWKSQTSQASCLRHELSWLTRLWHPPYNHLRYILNTKGDIYYSYETISVEYLSLPGTIHVMPDSEYVLVYLCLIKDNEYKVWPPENLFPYTILISIVEKITC